MSRIAINGFGRIGRSILRIIVEQQSDIEVVAINDLGDYKNLAYLLKHDSVMGILNENVSVDGDVMKVGDRSIKLISVKDPADLPWKDLEIDVVIESTGIFRDNDSLNKHLNAPSLMRSCSFFGSGSTEWNPWGILCFVADSLTISSADRNSWLVKLPGSPSDADKSYGPIM